MVPLVQLAILLCLEVWGALTIWPLRLLSNFPTFQSAWRQFEILLESPGKKKDHRATKSCCFGCLVISFKMLFYSFYLCICITWKMLVLNRWLLVPKFCMSNQFSPNSHRVIGVIGSPFSPTVKQMILGANLKRGPCFIQQTSSTMNLRGWGCETDQFFQFLPEQKSTGIEQKTNKCHQTWCFLKISD